MPLSHNSLSEIMVVMTVGTKYTSLIMTSVCPSIQQVIAILAIPIISSLPDTVDMNISSLSGCSSIITLLRLLQI